MTVGKIVKKGRFYRERLENPSELRKKGFSKFRTKTTPTGHKLIIAAKKTKKGAKITGKSKVQAVLHPEKPKHHSPASFSDSGKEKSRTLKSEGELPGTSMEPTTIEETSVEPSKVPVTTPASHKGCILCELGDKSHGH